MCAASAGAASVCAASAGAASVCAAQESPFFGPSINLISSILILGSSKSVVSNTIGSISITLFFLFLMVLLYCFPFRNLNVLFITL